MDKILIVDDDKILSRFIRQRLQKYNDRFEVILANNGEEAVQILKQKEISLLVTDIQMPQMNGLALLSHMNNEYAHIPCIVITSYPSSVLEDRRSNDNLFRLLPKPFQIEKLEESILQALEKDLPSGTLKGISVASFLQMIQLEQKTCLFEVRSPSEGKGLFYFQEGIPYDAVFGDLKGEEAAYEIIAMENAEITFRDLPKKMVIKRINTEVTGLVMEAFRRKDEANL